MSNKMILNVKMKSDKEGRISPHSDNIRGYKRFSFHISETISKQQYHLV